MHGAQSGMRFSFLMILTGLVLAAPTWAEERHTSVFEKKPDRFPQSRQQAQKIIDHCWSISLKDRSKRSLQIIDQGHQKTARCFEDIYTHLFLLIDINRHNKTEKEVRDQFANLKKAYQKIYYDINVARAQRAEGITSNIINTHYSLLLENIVADLIYTIHFYKEHNDMADGKIDEALTYLDNVTP